MRVCGAKKPGHIPASHRAGRATTRNRKIVARVAAGATLQEVAVGYGLTKQMISYINRRTTGRPIWFPQLDPDYVASEDYLA